MNLLRPLKSLAGLLIMIAALFAIMLSLGWYTYGELKRQNASPTDSAQWSIFQTSLEFNRLNNAYQLYRILDSEENLTELNRRFDIFYSRVTILNSGAVFRRFRDKIFFIQSTQSFTDFVKRMSEALDRHDYAALRHDPALHNDFQDIERNIASFVASAVQLQGQWDEDSRRQLTRLLLMQLITSGLVLLAFLYFAYVVIKQRDSAQKGERELRSRKDLLRATFDSSLDGVMIADAQGRIADINDSAAAMFGFEPGVMMGQDMATLIVPERLRSAHNAGMARYAETGKAKVIGRRIELDALRKDGTEFPVELSISASGTGAAAQYVAFMRDISERRMAEKSLQSAKDSAEAASRAKAQFLASISHEMRTPLTGILGALDLITETELSPVQRRHVQTANRSGHALLSVISDVLDISALESGKIDLAIETIDLQAIVGDVMEIIGKLGRERGNTICADIDPQIPANLSGDPARIRQVLLNLATNAVKFTYNGSVHISVTCLAVREGRAELEFAVRDTGPGIAEADKARLFQSFSQLSNGVQHPSGGSGLGLSISRRIMEILGGSIGVEAELGEGSRFWFRLELAIEAEQPAPNAGAAATLSTAKSGKPRSVLVVDDTETVRTIVAALLATRGHSAETADSAAKALAMLKSARFDAIILDISMPGMDGFEALRIIRGLPGGAGQTPVIALTAHALVEDRERCLAAGFNRFLTKPVRAAELEEAINGAVSEEAQSPRAEQPAVETRPPLFHLAELRQQFVSVAPADLRRIVDRFSTELDQQVMLLTGEGSEISPHHLRRIVHVLAGSASMIGAKRLAALASHLDQLATRHEDAELASAVDDLVAVIRDTHQAVADARATLTAESS